MDTPQPTPEEMQARVLHRDGLMLVIDKPAGIAVHRGPKGGPNLEASFDALRYGLPRPPVLAHRLDRDTSGCLVLGRHRKATASLGLLFKHGKISKTYWAVVEGGPVEDEGEIDIPLGTFGRRARLVAEARPERVPVADKMESAGAFFSHLPPCGGGRTRSVREGGDARQYDISRSPPSPTLPRKGGGSRSCMRQRSCTRCFFKIKSVDSTDLAGDGADHRPHPSVARA